MDFATVGAHGALAEQRVIGRCRLHAGDNGGSVGCTLERFDGLEIMQCAAVHAGMHHGRVDALELGREAFRERTRLVVKVPVERLGEDQALRRLEAERVHIGEKDEEACKVLPARDNAEFAGLLDRVRRVGTGICQPDDLSLRSLRLQQERREIGGVQWMAHLAEHLPAVRQHDGLGVAFERVPERVVRRDEKPAVAASLHDRLAGAVGERPGVIRPVHGVGGARLARQIGCGRTGDDENLILFLGDRVHSQRYSGIGHVEDRIDLVHVKPFSGDIGADVRLVLVIGRDDLDLVAALFDARILDRQLGGNDRALAGEVRIKA